MEINIPEWAQQLTLFGVMISSVVLGIWRYFKTEAEKIVHKQQPSQQLESSSSTTHFVDPQLMKELIDTLREHERELDRQSLRLTRSNSDLREALIDNTEAIHLDTNATLNMLRFMKQRGE